MNQSKTLQNMFAYLSAAMLSMCAITSSSAPIGAMLGGGIAFTPFKGEMKIEGKVGKIDNVGDPINIDDWKKLNSYVSGDILMAFVYIMNTNYVNVMFTLGAEIKFPQQKFGPDKDNVMMIISENFGAFFGIGAMFERMGHALILISAKRRSYEKGTSSLILSEIKSSSKWIFELSLELCLYLIKHSFAKVGPVLTVGVAMNGDEKHTVNLTRFNTDEITYSDSEEFTSKYNPFFVKLGIRALLTF